MPKVYLNDRGEPTPTPGGSPARGGRYLDDDGEPLAAADPINTPTPHELNLHTPQKISEPTTYAGGFWKGLKDYAKDLVSDPTTMAGVGSGIALATTPVTGPWGLAAAGALGAAGGAGGAHIVKQLRSGQAEDPIDVASSMGVEGAVGGALAGLPGAVKWSGAGPALVRRGAQLAERSGIEGLVRRHTPAALASHFGGPAAGIAVEAAQSPMVNRGLGRALEGVGEIPEAMQSLMGRVSGAGRASALEDAAAARRPGLDRAMGIGREAPQPMTPWAPDEAFAERWPGASGAAEAAEDVAAPLADVAEESAPNWIRPKSTPLDEAEFQRRFGGRSTVPDPVRDAARAAGDRRLASMASLEDGPLAGLSDDVADLPGLTRDQFHDRFLRQMMESLDRR